MNQDAAASAHVLLPSLTMFFGGGEENTTVTADPFLNSNAAADLLLLCLFLLSVTSSVFVMGKVKKIAFADLLIPVVLLFSPSSSVNVRSGKFGRFTMSWPFHHSLQWTDQITTTTISNLNFSCDQQLKVSSMDTVQSVKMQLYQQVFSTPAEQRLLYKDVELLEPDKTLEDCGTT